MFSRNAFGMTSSDLEDLAVEEELPDVRPSGRRRDDEDDDHAEHDRARQRDQRASPSEEPEGSQPVSTRRRNGTR